MKSRRRAPCARAALHALALLLFVAPAWAVVLHDQTDACTNTYPSSENIVTQPAQESRVADDFSVPAGATWNVEMVSPHGGYSNGGQTAASFAVIFYADSGGSPGSPLCSYAAADAYRKIGNTFDITLPDACPLAGGLQGAVYWVSVQANLYPNPVVDWGWEDRSVQSGNAAHAEYPGGPDPTCVSWQIKQACFGVPVDPDQCFSLSGNDTVFRDDFE